MPACTTHLNLLLCIVVRSHDTCRPKPSTHCPTWLELKSAGTLMRARVSGRRPCGLGQPGLITQVR